MVTKNQVAVVRDAIIKIESELKKVLPKAMPSDKFLRTVLTAVQLNPGIAEANTKSVLAACMKAAADGLLLDGREAVLVVYRSKAGPMAQYLPMVQGIIKKVRQSGEVSVLNSFVVYENDEYEVVYGLQPSITHRPAMSGERGDPVAVYAVCQYKDGTHDFETMTFAEVEAIRNRSKAKNSGPWVTDWGEMARKTAIRRLSKRLPMSTDTLAMVARIDELYDLGQTDTDHVPSRRKTRGAGAAALNEADGEADLETDPETGEVIDGEAEVLATEDPEPEPEPEPEPKKETKGEKAVRLAEEKLAKAKEVVAAEAEGEEAPPSEDLI